jgi:hypothetical protein
MDERATVTRYGWLHSCVRHVRQREPPEQQDVTTATTCIPPSFSARLDCKGHHMVAHGNLILDGISTCKLLYATPLVCLLGEVIGLK